MAGKIKSLLIVYVTVFLFFIVFAFSSDAATLYVGPDEIYLDIQSAVDDANDGDTVLVQPGPYILSSQITIVKPITVQSIGGPDVTVIDGNDVVRCFYINHSSAVLDGFTVTNGYEQYGGGIYISTGGVVRNCTITGNVANHSGYNGSTGAIGGDGAAFGGGVYIEENGMLKSCNINGNFAAGHGGNGGSGRTSNILRCTDGGDGGDGAGYGGGIYIAQNATVQSCYISQNSAKGYGGWGGAAGVDAYIPICGCIPGEGGDGVGYGGGIYISQTAALLNCLIDGNTAYGEGGAWVWGYCNDPGGYGNGFGYGGGIYFVDEGSVQNCLITNNSSIGYEMPVPDADFGGYGGGIYCEGTAPIIRNTIVYFNSADTSAPNYYNGTFSFSCTTPDPGGTENITGDPLFVDADTGDYHLSTGSPCIDTATSEGAPSNDLDGYPRPLGGGFDRGAYEYALGDTDDDGTPDNEDLCLYDPGKTEPGLCGCGVADTDTDDDGTLDCEDECVNDPDKTEPGVCGCGVDDTDTDSDSTLDCNDECVNDPAKTESGICGCGVAETDTDGDSTPDCNDECMDDPAKTEPDTCGCGVADTDTDYDGTPDCNDGCPDDPDKIEPGECGCNVAEGTCSADDAGDNPEDSGSGGGGCFIKTVRGE